MNAFEIELFSEPGNFYTPTGRCPMIIFAAHIAAVDPGCVMSSRMLMLSVLNAQSMEQYIVAKR